MQQSWPTELPVGTCALNHLVEPSQGDRHSVASFALDWTSWDGLKDASNCPALKGSQGGLYLPSLGISVGAVACAIVSIAQSSSQLITQVFGQRHLDATGGRHRGCVCGCCCWRCWLWLLLLLLLQAGKGCGEGGLDGALDITTGRLARQLLLQLGLDLLQAICC